MSDEQPTPQNAADRSDDGVPSPAPAPDAEAGSDADAPVGTPGGTPDAGQDSGADAATAVSSEAEDPEGDWAPLTLLSVGSEAAEALHRSQPHFPPEAIGWVAGVEPCIVLELAAATGRLTAPLVELGHAVHACEADPALFDILEREVQGASLKRARAENVPANPASVDLIVVGQSFGSLDGEAVVREAARILRPGGRLALLWSTLDVRIPWVRRLGEVVGNHDHAEATLALLEESEPFGVPEHRTFKFWQDVTAETVVDMALCRGDASSMDEAGREHLASQALALYDAYGRGNHGMQVPHVVHCVSVELRGDETGDDEDVLLIDFR